MKTFGVLLLYILLVIIAGCLVLIVFKVGEIYAKQVGRDEQIQITSNTMRDEFLREEKIGNVYENSNK